MKVADYNHVIIYAKGWYKEGNVLEDLRKIFSKRSLIDPQHLSDGDIWDMMVSVLMKYGTAREVEGVLDGMFKPRIEEGQGFLKFFDANCPLERAVGRIITVLQQLTMKDGDGNRLTDLGRPDPEILPMAKKIASALGRNSKKRKGTGMKKVTIMRGPSGAGKSTIVEKTIIKDGCQAVVCSVDRHFEGEEYDPRKLPEYHQRCMGEFLQALLMENEHVIVDNTNIRRWEYNNYELAARLAGYEVEIIEVVPKTIEEMKLCASRNVHGVPVATVAKYVMTFEHDARAIQMPVLED